MRTRPPAELSAPLRPIQAIGKLAPGLYDIVQTVPGIHGGDIETSLMREFRPDLAHMWEARNFVCFAIAMENQFTHLSADRAHGYGLNAPGAVGDARKATVAKRPTVDHHFDDFIALLHAATAFPLTRLCATDADRIR